MVLRYFITFILTFFTLTYAQATKSAYGLYSYDHTEYELAFNKLEPRSIASITKMFTAYTVIQSGVNLDEKVKVNGRSSGRLPNGLYVSRIDLLRATIISSDNRAAETLANHHPGGFKKFIQDVNKHAEDMSLYHTKIVDSTGLLAGNVSTVYDLKEFLYNIKDDPVIKSISNEKQAIINVPKGKRTVSVTLKNTNPDIFIYDNILISKTGFTNAAGRCVLMLVEKGKELFAIVILGQPTTKARSAIVQNLISVETFKIPEPKINLTVEYPGQI